MARRAFGWWAFAVDALSLLTTPRTDSARSDREVEALLRESALFTAGRAMRHALGRAWIHSQLRATLTPMWSTTVPRDSAARVRLTAAIAVIASFAAAALQAMKSDPLSWVVPAVVAAAGLALGAAAGPVARALEDKTR